MASMVLLLPDNVGRKRTVADGYESSEKATGQGE
jgi:hypothetical protein